MAEYQHFDGETYITFNIVYATEKEVQLAVTNRGRISVKTFDLLFDGKLRFAVRQDTFKPCILPDR